MRSTVNFSAIKSGNSQISYNNLNLRNNAHLKRTSGKSIVEGSTKVSCHHRFDQQHVSALLNLYPSDSFVLIL